MKWALRSLPAGEAAWVQWGTLVQVSQPWLLKESQKNEDEIVRCEKRHFFV